MTLLSRLINVCFAFQAPAKKAPKAPARKRQATVVKTASSKPRTAADAMKAKKEASAAAAKEKKGRTPATKAKKVRTDQYTSIYDVHAERGEGLRTPSI